MSDTNKKYGLYYVNGLMIRAESSKDALEIYEKMQEEMKNSPMGWFEGKPITPKDLEDFVNSQKDMPSDISQYVNEHFWDLVHDVADKK
jgi:hypothetical protein